MKQPSTAFLLAGLILVGTLALATGDYHHSSSEEDSERLPDNFLERIEAINKWFELRMSVYRKANTLLKQLIHKVHCLAPFHNGIDVYYHPWRQTPLMSPTVKLAINRGRNATQKARVSEMVRHALNQKEIKYVLNMVPEINDVFNKVI